MVSCQVESMSVMAPKGLRSPKIILAQHKFHLQHRCGFFTNAWFMFSIPKKWLCCPLQWVPFPNLPNTNDKKKKNSSRAWEKSGTLCVDLTELPASFWISSDTSCPYFPVFLPTWCLPYPWHSGLTSSAFPTSAHMSAPLCACSTVPPSWSKESPHTGISALLGTELPWLFFLGTTAFCSELCSECSLNIFIGGRKTKKAYGMSVS